MLAVGMSMMALMARGDDPHSTTTVTYDQVKDESILKFQMLGTHDAYHLRPDPYVPLSYHDKPTLTEQLGMGIRAFELDLIKTDDPAVFNVYHIKMYDELSTVATLKAAIDEIKAFLNDPQAGYHGEPIYVGMEPQNSDLWTAQDYMNLNMVVNTELTDDFIFGPDDMGAMPGFSGAEWNDWSVYSLADLTNRIVLRNNGRNLADYFDAQTLDPAALHFFYSCRKNEAAKYYCKLFNVNDPVNKFDDIMSLSATDMVKCNADSEFIEVEGTTFEYDGDMMTWMATTGEETVPVLDWAACLMFGVIDRDNDMIATYNESYMYGEYESEGSAAMIGWMQNNLMDISPVMMANCSALGEMYLQLFGEPNVNRSYTEKVQNEYALNSGCQIIQTEHILADHADHMDYYFNLQCGGLSDVEYRYTNETGSYCVLFDIHDMSSSMMATDGDGGMDGENAASLATRGLAVLLAALLVLLA